MSDERLPRNDESLMGRLLVAGDRDEPSPRVVGKSLAAVGLASAATGIAGTASAGASAGGASAILKWLAIGAIAGTSATVGGGEIVEQVRSDDAPHASLPPQPPTKPLPPIATTIEPAAAVEPPIPSPTPSASDGNPPKASASGTGTPATPSASTSANPDTLIAEAALIGRASQAVRQRDGAAALSAVHDYQSRFPRGKLLPEATVLEVEALVLLGQRDSARALARRFLVRHPESPSAKRLRTLTGLSE